jgi:hypothetical protein
MFLTVIGCGRRRIKTTKKERYRKRRRRRKVSGIKCVGNGRPANREKKGMAVTIPSQGRGREI